MMRAYKRYPEGIHAMNAEQKIVEVVYARGGHVYLVGGSVRDELLGLEAKDRDYLVTGVSVEVLSEGLREGGFKVDLVGKSFGVVKATLDGVTYDLALPRTERSTGTGHRDFEVTADPYLPVEADLARRDFTINAIAVRLSDGEVVDPFCGRADLRDGFIRAVGDAVDRFTEDPLRMMRAMRFTAKLGFLVAPGTANAIHSNAALLSTVAPERIQEELIRLVSYANPIGVANAMKSMRSNGLLFEAFGPDFALVAMKAHFDFDALGHVVAQGGPLEARLAAIFQRVPKYGAVMERLKFSNELRAAVEHVVSAAERLNVFMEREFRKTVAQLPSFELFEAAVHLWRANSKSVARYTGFDTLRIEAEAVKTLESAKPLAWLHGFGQANVAVSGGDLAAEFGCSGPDIGALKRAAALAVIDGVVANEREALLRHLKEVWWGQGN